MGRKGIREERKYGNEREKVRAREKYGRVKEIKAREKIWARK